MCREEGLQLSDAAKDKLLDGFNIFGVVKEAGSGVDDDGLEEFYRKYFSYPLYLDRKKEFYAALGGRTLSFTSLFGLIPKSFGSLGQRLKEKQIEGNFKGEGFLQGGVMLFDSVGDLMYSYQEVTGEELPMDEILEAVENLRGGSSEL